MRAEMGMGMRSQESDRFQHLVSDLFARVMLTPSEEIDAEVALALSRVRESLEVNDVRLLRFDGDGRTLTGIERSAHGSVPPGGTQPAAESRDWYVSRLATGQPLAIVADCADGPERELLRSLGVAAHLSMPVLVGSRLVCALTIGLARPPASWPGPLADRVRLVAEMLAAGLERRRQDLAMRDFSAEIDRLNARLSAENAYLQEEIKTYHNFDDLVGTSAALGAALAQVSQVAPTDSTVLLLGETGTGKELVARAIHARSARAKRPLVCVNCAALPPTLIESELFGHERGAFTNAVNMRQGRFELADGGTIFLDEIGDLPPEIQAKLLRVLQEGEFERVGASRSRKVDVRVIAATHHNLAQTVEARTFRADLYYRLSVFPVQLPPLRERREDIPQLVWFFIHQRQRKLGRQIKNVPSAVMSALQRYRWPGNVRELENIVERAMIRATGDTLLLDEMFGAPVQQGTEESAVELNAVERTHIEHILRECGGKINGRGNAAERLGIHPNSLRFRMKKLGVSRPVHLKGGALPPARSFLRAVGAS